MSRNIIGKELSWSRVYHNPSVGKLYSMGTHTHGNQVSDAGALVALSGAKTGRSPKDKRIVKEASSEDNIWWGPINTPLSSNSFERNMALAIDYLSESDQVYVIDGFAGWQENEKIKVRVFCTLPYHALFMVNMLIRPTPEELAEFGEPDWVIYNAGGQQADPSVEGVDSTTSVALSFDQQEIVILGTEYAGEMKKGVFTVLNYTLPLRGIFPMHCSANRGNTGEVALFFGLSGTGKTTLSADPHRSLIGDDEHGWSDAGVFNFEGGCYAKTINLSPENEPDIFHAIRFGSVLENVVLDEKSGVVDYSDVSITQNTRCSYPIEYIDHAVIPCVGAHPHHVIFLTCDAFGVLPPVSKLSKEQAMYHFVSGYTAKVAGTEVGVHEPEATFSPCFGAAFLVWHPIKYAELLAEKMEENDVEVWLINTGWAGGSATESERISLVHTRAIVDAVLAHELNDVPCIEEPVFGLQIPSAVPHVPSHILVPEKAWSDPQAYQLAVTQLAAMFTENFEKYAGMASAEVIAAGPAPVSC